MRCGAVRICLSILALCLICGPAHTLAAAAFRSYTVPADSIDAIQTALRPLLSETARFSRLDGKLLVIGSDADHRIVEALLYEFDQKTIQYTVTVIQGASQQQTEKLLAANSLQRTLTVSSQPNEARIASVRTVAGETTTVRTDQARDKASSAWSGQRSSGYVNTEEVVSRGFEVSVVPKGTKVEVTIAPLISFPKANDPTTRVARTGKTRIVVPLDKWVAVYSDARFDNSAYDHFSTLLKVRLSD